MNINALIGYIQDCHKTGQIDKRPADKIIRNVVDVFNRLDDALNDLDNCRDERNRELGLNARIAEVNLLFAANRRLGDDLQATNAKIEELLIKCGKLEEQNRFYAEKARDFEKRNSLISEARDKFRKRMFALEEALGATLDHISGEQKLSDEDLEKCQEILEKTR